MKQILILLSLVISGTVFAGTVDIDNAGSPSCFDSVRYMNEQLTGNDAEPFWTGYSNVIDSEGKIRSTELYAVNNVEEGPGEITVYEVLGAEGSGCAFVSAKAKYFSKDLGKIGHLRKLCYLWAI